MVKEPVVIGKHNNSINIMKLISSWLVVAIHTHPFMDINSQAGFFSTEVITRIAVPFFFLVSGFYYCQRITVDRNYFKIYIMKLFPEYCMWSAIYYIINLITAINNGYFSIKGYIWDCIIGFFLCGPYYHLWYIPAVFIAVLIVTFAEKHNLKKGLIFLTWLTYIVGVLSYSYYQLGINTFGLGELYQRQGFETIRRIVSMGLPFFVAGYLIPYYYKKISNSSLLLTIFFVINVFEIYFVVWKQWSNGVVLTFTLYPLVILILVFCLQHPMNNLKSTAWQNKVSKFIYFSHPIFISIFQDSFFMNPTMIFFCVCFTCTLIGICIFKIKAFLISKV